MATTGKGYYYYASFGMLLAAGGLAFLASRDRPAGQAQLLAASPDVLDFGHVKAGKLDGEFTLTNQSDKSVQIDRVISSCACHKVAVTRKPIEPGKSVKATFQWDARSARGESQTQFVVAYKVVGDGQVRFTKCVCRADVIAPFEFEPREVSFSLAKKEKQTAVVKFRPTQPGDFIVTSTSCGNPAFSATRDENKNEVTVSFDPQKWHLQDANFQQAVKVRTSFNPDFDCRVPLVVRE